MALVPSSSLRQLPIPDIVRERLHELVQSARNSSNDLAQLYGRLRAIEDSLYHSEPRLDPSAVRRLLPASFTRIIFTVIPKERFAAPGRCTAGKLRKACKVWGVDPTLLLFQIGNDYGRRRGAPFLKALLDLSVVCDDWDRCLNLLNDCVSVRQRLGNVLQCVQRTDVINVISILTATAASVYHEDGASLTDYQGRSSSEDEQETEQDAATPVSAALSEVSSIASTGALLEGSPSDDYNQVLAASTPERSRREPSLLFERSNQESSCRGQSEAEDSARSTKEPEEARHPGDDCHLFSTEDKKEPEDNYGLEFPSSPAVNPPLSKLVSPAVSGNISVYPESEASDFDLGPLVFPSQPGRHPFFGDTNSKPACRTESHSTSQSTLVSPPAEMGDKEPPGHKRPRLEPQPHTSSIPEEQVADLLLENTWLTADWLNKALQTVCATVAPRFCPIDSAEVRSMTEGDYTPRTAILANVLESETVILPLHVYGNHWVLGVVEHAHCAAISVKLYDSLMSDHHAKAAQGQVDAFIKHYLPSSPRSRRLIESCLSNRQPNGFDCGVFCFAFAVFKMAREDLPQQLHSGMWRRIIATCLGAVVADWDSLLPPTSSSQIADDEVSPISPAKDGSSGDKFSRFAAERARFERERAALLSQLDADFINMQVWNGQVAPVVRALDALVRAAAVRTECLMGTLQKAKAVEAASGTCGADASRGLYPSSTKLTRQHGEAELARERVAASIRHLSRLGEMTDKMCEKWSQGMMSVTGKNTYS